MTPSLEWNGMSRDVLTDFVQRQSLSVIKKYIKQKQTTQLDYLFLG